MLISAAADLTVTNASSGAPVQAVWSTSDPTVASVSMGHVIGVGPGRATISASYMGSTATLSIKVVPNYTGTYDGGLFVVECVDGVPSFCDSNVLQEKRGERPEPFLLRLTQAKDTVAGNLFMRGARGEIQGAIDTLGRLSVSSTIEAFPALAHGGTLLTFELWSTSLNAAGTRMSGTLSIRYTDKTTGVLLGIARAEMRGIDRVP